MENNKGIYHIRCIDNESFARYGTVIQAPGRHEDGYYQVLVEETESPWKLAIYEFDRRSTRVLERHPSSMESFEPLRGTALLVLAPTEAPGDLEVFLLDVPVCLFKGIWHQVLSLSDHAQVKITENILVTSEFHELDQEIAPALLSTSHHQYGPARTKHE